MYKLYCRVYIFMKQEWFVYNENRSYAEKVVFAFDYLAISGQEQPETFRDPMLSMVPALFYLPMNFT